MDTLILVSGGWRSAYALVYWLRSHPGKVYALHCRLADGHDRARSFADPAIRTYVEHRFPGRVVWHDCGWSNTFASPSDARASLLFFVSSFLATPVGNQIKQVIVGKKIDVARKAEVVADVQIIDAIGEIPGEVWRALHYCESLPACGKCPQCLEIETAYNQIRG